MDKERYSISDFCRATGATEDFVKSMIHDGELDGRIINDEFHLLKIQTQKVRGIISAKDKIKRDKLKEKEDARIKEVDSSQANKRDTSKGYLIFVGLVLFFFIIAWYFRYDVNSSSKGRVLIHDHWTNNIYISYPGHKKAKKVPTH